MADAAPPIRRGHTVVLAAIAGLALLALAVQVVRQWGMEVPYDFEVYWNIGRMLGDGDADLYGWQEGRNEWVYLYPPFFAAAFVPLSQLSPPVACGLWMAAQIPLLAVCLWGLFKLVGADTPRTRALVAASVLAPLFMAFHRNIGWGQVNLLILALCVWGLHFDSRGRRGWAGLSFAAGANLKLIPVALLPVLLARRRFVTVILTVAFGLVLTLAPALWLVPHLGIVESVSRSVQLNADYAAAMVVPRTASRDPSGIGTEGPNNLAPSAVLLRLNSQAGEPLNPGVARWAGALLGLMMFASAVLLAARRRDPLVFALAAGLALAAAVFAQITVWHHHLVIMAMPLGAVAVLHSRGRIPKWGLPVVCALLALLVSLTGSDKIPMLTLLRAWGVTSLGGLLAWCLMAWFGFTARPEPDGAGESVTASGGTPPQGSGQAPLTP